MDEIVKGVVETTSVPENVEQLVKINIKDGKASATLFANPNGSSIKRRLDELEERFNNLKTINYEELYGPGNIDIKQGGGSSGGGEGDVTKVYVDEQDEKTLTKAKEYTDSKVGSEITNLRDYVDKTSSTILEQAKEYADSLSYGGGEGGDKATVVLIDAVNRASQARTEAYTAHKEGKAIVLKCAADKYIPMTVTAESNDSVDLKGFDLSYSGYEYIPEVTLVTRMWTLDSKGLNYTEKSVPINSCRTFDCTGSSNVSNIFNYALDTYNKGLSVILKVNTNTFVLANTATSDSLIGYSFQFNPGKLENGESGIVSVDIVRWRLTSSGVTRDSFSTEGGGGSTGGGVTLTQYYSTNTVAKNTLPSNPSDDPTFWNQTKQTVDSIWAAQKATGYDWTMWKLLPKDGEDGKPGKDGDDGITPNTSFKSMVFKRTNTKPDAPDASEGSYNNPVPSGWSDGAPSGEEQLWMSTRIFSSDGESPQQSAWTTPSAVSDNEFMDYEFSSKENPGEPNKKTPSSPELNTNWSNEADTSTIWMAMRQVSNGAYAEGSSWKIMKIKGEKGEDGTSVKIKGKLNSTDELPKSGNTIGDAYLIDGDLWIWDGDSWENVGKIKGEKGDDGNDGKSPYLHIKYSNDGGNTFTDNNGEVPGDYIGMYWDYIIDDSSDTSSYTWKYVRGEDGFGYEYIFKLTETYEAPDVPQIGDDYDDYLPTGWTDDAGDVSEDMPFCWVCYRRKISGHWSAYKGSSKTPGKAALFCSFGTSGVDAITVDFTNDVDGVNLTYEGKVDGEQTVSTYVGAFEGEDAAEIKKIEYTPISGVTISTSTTGSGIDNYPGIITATFADGSEALKEGINSIDVKVTIRCKNATSIEHVSKKTFKVLGNKPGAPGQDAVTYRIITNVHSVRKFSDGSYDTDSISVKKVEKRVGRGDFVETTEGVIKYCIDTYDESKAVTIALNTGVSVANINKFISFYYYVDGKLADGPEDVPINVDGEMGATNKIVSEKVYYYVSNSYINLPSSISSADWSETPFDLEPGQYLYIKKVRTWESGDVTYDYSWTRSGLDGFSNLPFISTVFTISSSQPSTPSGGTYSKPLPDSTSWSDGIPSGSGTIWLSTRKFTVDGANPQEATWSTPIKATSDIDSSGNGWNIRYSSLTACPKAPDVDVASAWHTTPLAADIWGAFQKVANNIKSPWNVRRIYGEGIKIEAETTSAATPFMGEWNADTEYYGTKTRTDIVRVSGTSGADDPNTYYYIANKAKNFDGEITPQPGTTAGEAYWLKFGANFDNIATGFLFSEKISTQIIDAVNAKIDNLDVDNLVAKKLRTNESGNLISIENNKILSLTSDATTFTVDPEIEITSSLGLSCDNTVSYSGNKTIYGTSITSTSNSVISQTVTLTTISRKNFNGYLKSIVASKDRIRIVISGANITYFSAGFTITAKGNSSSSTPITLASCTVVRRSLCYDYIEIKPTSVKKLPLSDGDIFTISINYSYVITKPNSSTTTIGATLIDGGTIKIFDNDNIFIGKDGMRIGSNLGGQKILMSVNRESNDILSISDGDNDIFTIGSSLKVNTDSRGLVELNNPMIYNIGSNTSIAKDDMDKIYSCFVNGTPVYLKGVYDATFGSNTRTVSYMSMIESMYPASSLTTGGTCTFLATCGLHDMSNLTDTTDYRLNIFIKGSISTVSGGIFSGAATVSIYQHTV